MSFFSEKQAGLDRLPDGRWTYTPINIIGRINEEKWYLIDEDLKGKICSSFKIIKGAAIVIGFFTAQAIARQKWNLMIEGLILMSITFMYFNYKFRSFGKGLKANVIIDR